MVMATLTTAGVTLAARSAKSWVASPAIAAGAVNIGTMSAGAVIAVVRARAAKMRDLRVVMKILHLSSDCCEPTLGFGS
jgi:peptidase E